MFNALASIVKMIKISCAHTTNEACTKPVEARAFFSGKTSPLKSKGYKTSWVFGLNTVQPRSSKRRPIWDNHSLRMYIKNFHDPNMKPTLSIEHIKPTHRAWPHLQVTFGGSRGRPLFIEDLARIACADPRKNGEVDCGTWTPQSTLMGHDSHDLI